MSTGCTAARQQIPVCGVVNSAIVPAVVIRPIFTAVYSVNHSAPSGPATIPTGPLFAVGTGNWVI